MAKCCSIDGCDGIHYARGVCKPHYRRQPDQLAHEQRYQSDPDVRVRRRQSDRKRQSTRQAYITEWGRRKAMPRWAAWWEDRRRAEDLASAAPLVVYGKAAQRISSRPKTRQWTAGSCIACGAGWIDYTKRKPSGYCKRCQDRRWAADSRHKRRAWKQAALVIETISPETVFKKDGYRCQICKRKTRGTYPHPRAPTIDHIIPLSQGGEHSYLNVQCACFQCNTRKGDRAANDQLRLIA